MARHFRESPISIAPVRLSDSVWILIPVRNRVAVTLRCLRRLHEIGLPPGATVLVLDDGSTDSTTADIRREFPDVLVENGPGNWWWTGAIRHGMAMALDGEAAFVIWLNDDCLPENDALNNLLKAAHETQGICGGICHSSQNGELTYSGGNMKGGWPQRLAVAPSSPLPCDWLHGNLLCLPTKVCHQIGLPDAEHLPHNWGDIEYTYRAHHAGVPVTLVPGSRGTCDRNQGPLFQSWIDPRLPLRDIWFNLFNPKVWWYLPGLSHMMLRHFGGKGVINVGKLLGKLVFLSLFRPLIPHRLLLRLRGKRKPS